MMFYYLFLAGLMVGDFATPKAKVVIIDNGQIVQEVRAGAPVLVVKNGPSVELRLAKTKTVREKEVVVNKAPMTFRRDTFGGFTMDCHECMEDKAEDGGTAEAVVWNSGQ